MRTLKLPEIEGKNVLFERLAVCGVRAVPRNLHEDLKYDCTTSDGEPFELHLELDKTTDAYGVAYKRLVTPSLQSIPALVSIRAGMKLANIKPLFSLIGELAGVGTNGTHTNDKGVISNATLQHGKPTYANGIHSPKEDAAPSPMEQALARLRTDQAAIARRMCSPITFAEPIIRRGEDEIIFPRTITLVQGKFGRHKSRITENFCSAFLKKDGYTAPNGHLGFVASEREFALLYVDTERNLLDQLPFALQQIKVNAGYALADDVPNFDFFTLMNIPREQRFNVLSSYLETSRRRFGSAHLVVVLDVCTDLVGSFNDVRESMALVDLLNGTINEHDVSVLCVIHENPNNGGESKARGHAGSELTNKASTVIGLDFVRDAADKETQTVVYSLREMPSNQAP